MTELLSEPFRVYWIPGCTSCLKLKEFMKKQGIPFVSINAVEQANARQELEEMGCKGLPVLARGREFVIAQTLEPVIKFLKRDIVLLKLSMPEMMERMLYFLEAASRLAAQLPEKHYNYQPMPDRDRTAFKIAYHCVQIPDSFIETVEVGGTDLMAIFESPPPADMTTASQVVSYATEVYERIATWWSRQDQQNVQGVVKTFYGDQTLFEFAERSTWHCAQHVRQLQYVLESLEVPITWRVEPTKYDGLPIPDGLWA